MLQFQNLRIPKYYTSFLKLNNHGVSCNSYGNWKRVVKIVESCLAVDYQVCKYETGIFV